MQTSTTGGRALAIAAGLIFTAGALAILLGDVVFQGAEITLKHGLTIITILGTMMVGHLASDAWRSRHWLSAIGFGLLFMAGTALTVYTSVGRQSETSTLSAAQAEATNEARALAKRGLSEAETQLRDSQRDLARECKTGRGKRCDGIQATIAVYSAAVKGHQADLDRLGPAKPVNPEAEQFAELAAVFGFNKEKVKAAAVLGVPFLTTLLMELGGIWSFGYGFRHTQRAAPSIASKPAEQADLHADIDAATIATLRGNFDPENEPPKPRGSRKTNLQSNVIAFPATHPVIRALENVGGSVASNHALAVLMGVTDGEASKRVREVAGLLAIERHGKETRISLKTADAA